MLQPGRMTAIGEMMIEHRVIERMINALARQAEMYRTTGKADLELLDTGVGFLRTYADRCHHGKEEDILFRDLAHKQLEPQLATVLAELIEEHRQGRLLVNRLASAVRMVRDGQDGGREGLLEALASVVEFYPPHIAKEDRSFFRPAWELFSATERTAMLAEGYAFDSRLLHDSYRAVAEAAVGSATPQG